MPKTADLDAIARRVAAMIRKGEGSAYDTGPAPILRAVLDDDGNGTGAYLLEVDGEELAQADDAHGALALVEGLDWFVSAVERKHPDDLAGEAGLGDGRWFDAARQEDLPAVQGGQITRERIDEMVRNLAGLSRAPIIDGGLKSSDPHGSVSDPTNTPATGYVLAGVRAVDEEGTWHLWLYGRLRPEVDAAVDARAIVYGSVAFLEEGVHPYTGEEIGARLLSYALTSEPYQDGLRPHRARADELTEALLSMSRTTDEDVTAHAHVRTTTPRKTQTMPKTTIPADAKRRGAAADLLSDFATKVGVPFDAAAMDDEQLFALQDRFQALLSAASIEDALDGEPAPEMPEEGAEEGERAPAENGEEDDGDERAVEGLEGDALDAWGMATLDLLRGIFQSPEASPEQALEMLSGSAEAFAGAMEGEEPPAEDAAEGGQEQGDERTAMRAQTIVLEQTVATQRAELLSLQGYKRAREISDYIDERFAAAELQAPVGERRAELVEICETTPDFQKVVDLSLRAANVPPSGLTPTHPTAETPAPPAGEPASVEEALARTTDELKNGSERLSKKQLRARAYSLVRTRWPSLVERKRRPSAAE